jgi:hypothetical protein
VMACFKLPCTTGHTGHTGGTDFFFAGPLLNHTPPTTHTTHTTHTPHTTNNHQVSTGLLDYLHHK